MAITKRQLCTRVLREALPMADSMAAIAAEDLALVEGIYDTKHVVWRDMGLVFWPNTNATTSEIPEVVADALIALMGNACGRAFGVPDSLVNQMAMEEMLLRPLRRHIAKPTAGEATSFSDY